MSDIGILNDPLSLIAIALIFGSPRLLLGGIAGALLWRGTASLAAFWAPAPASCCGWADG
jgi:hypothetical protein